MSALVVLTAVAPAKAADRLARRVVLESKAACVSVTPGAISHYRWKGKVRRSGESLLWIKTTRAAWPTLLKFLETNHPYDVPEILALPVSHGSKAYLKWLRCTGLALCLFLTGGAFGVDRSWAEDNFVQYVEAQKEYLLPPHDTESVMPEELRAMQVDGTVTRLFDARMKQEFLKEHIAGASLPLPDDYYTQEELFRQKIVPVSPDRPAALAQSMLPFPRETVIVTYCNRHCSLSKNLMHLLKELGFTNVRYLAGGIDSWREKGYPLEVQKT